MFYNIFIMNIALFTDCYLPSKNGVVTVIDQLEQSLTKLGHHVVVVTPEYIGRDQIEGYSDSPKVLRVKSKKLGMGMKDQFLGFPNAKKVGKFLKENNIEIIHSHTEFTLGLHAKKQARKLGIPVVATTHTMWEDYYKFYIPGGKLIPVGLVRKVLKAYYKKFTAIINVSAKAFDYFKKPFITPDMPAAIIPNAINPKNYCTTVSTPEEIKELRTQLGIADDEQMLVFVGRVVEEKRVYELLETLTTVFAQKDKVKAVFVGDGPALEHSKEIAKKNGIEDRVVFTGFVDWHIVHRYYEAADIFMTASLSEMHSMTVLEAMTSKLPIVVRKDSSYYDTVIPEYNGFLSETDEQMAKDLITLLDDKEMQKTYGENGKKQSLYFLPDTFGRRYEAFYSAVINATKAGRKPTDEELKAAVDSVEVNG